MLVILFENMITPVRVCFRGRLTIIAVALTALAITACGGTPSAVNVQSTVDAAVYATMQASTNTQATIDAAVAATLQSQLAPIATVTPGLVVATPLPVATTAVSLPDLEQIQQVIDSEVQGAVSKNLALLQSIYAPDAVVIDRAGTPDNFADDTTWQSWPNIERRYRAFFSVGVSSVSLVGASVQVDGERAIVTHNGTIMDGTLYPDYAVYTLARRNGQWLITGLEYGNQSTNPVSTAGGAVVVTGSTPIPHNDGLYQLAVGNQHRYEEPWGWDKGDPCTAWQSGNFDDTKPYYRGFNVELLLTNNSDQKVPDDWPVSFTTANSKNVKACYYSYPGSGPLPGATSSVTFFTVVDQGDYVKTITLNLEDQTIKICLDGRGDWWPC